MATVFIPSANDPAVFTTDKFPLLKDGDGNTYRTVVKANVNGSIDVYSKGTGLFGGDELLFQYSGTRNSADFTEGKFKDKPSTAFNSFFRSSGSNGEQFLKDAKTKWYSEAPPNAATRMATLRGYQSIAATTQARQTSNGPQSITIQTGAGTTTIVSSPSPDPDPVITAFTGNDFNPTTYENTEKAETKLNGGILVYPRDHGNSEFDFISIQPIEYIAQLNLNNLPAPTESGFTSLETASQRLRKEVKTGPPIYLPMTPGISETNSVSWGEDKLNAAQLALGNKAMGIISNPQSPTDLDTALGNLSGIANTLKELADSPGLKNYISAYFAGQAVSANLLGRAGIVINPNLELLFQGPKLRSFRYNFKFTPRDADEAEIIRAIIKTLKKTMAVRRNSTSIFLGVPSVYKIKYVYNGNSSGGNDHPFLNKIKPCALTSFNVNYTPDGSYMTYQDGSMTSYNVDMQFDELEPIYNEDIDNVDSATMGY